MKKQIAGLLTGLLVCSAFLTGCGKNEATEAVKESVEDENEGTGDTKDADSKKDTNRKSDKQDSDKSDENSEESETTEAPEENLDKVGVLLPEEGEDINSSLERTELKSRLEEAGYEAAMYFAGDDSDTQAEQIRELLQDEKLKALVISPVDPYGLTDVLEEASELSIGKEIAKNIVEKEELDKVREDRGARTIEFLMGSPADDASLFLFNGIMEVLQEYIDDGTLICRSGRVTFDETSIMDQNTDTAKKQLKSEIDEFYSLEKTPDIICTASDDFALAALELLEKEQLQPGDENWPLITGVNADADAVKSVAEEKIGFTVMLDRRDLAEALTKLVETYLNGDDVDINNYSQYDNGVKIIGTVTCDGKLIDKDNYQILVDNGFYLAEMIAPEASPMPVPEEVSPTPEVTVTPEASLTPEGGEPEKKSQVIPKDEPEVSTEEVPAVKDGENQESNSKLQSSGKA